MGMLKEWYIWNIKCMRTGWRYADYLKQEYYKKEKGGE